jgi:hypothetical protein
LIKRLVALMSKAFSLIRFDGCNASTQAFAFAIHVLEHGRYAFRMF